jgi:hypothetical protein
LSFLKYQFGFPNHIKEYNYFLKKLASDVEHPASQIVHIDDCGYNLFQSNSFASIVSFEHLCSIIVTDDQNFKDTVIRYRDWGRVGSQDEAMELRYQNWTIKDVKYDWKFVFNEIGFNFKSSEISAVLALQKFNKIFPE